MGEPMRERIEQQLEAMLAQAAHLEEQLIMTRGAIQILEHLLKDEEKPAQKEAGNEG